MKLRSLAVVLFAILADVALAQEPVEPLDRELFAGHATPRDQALAFAAKAGVLFTEALGRAGGNTDQAAYGLVGVVETETKLGDFRAAKTTAAAIPPRLGFREGHGGFLGFGPRDKALDIIAKAELQDGDLDAAVRTASEITYQPTKNYEPGLKSDFPDRHGILRAVIQKLTAARRYEQAVGVARNLIPKPQKIAKSQSLKGVIVEFADLDLSETMSPLFGAMAADGQSSEARRLAKSLLVSRPDEWNKAMQTIALEQAKAGDVAGAKKWAAQFFQPACFAELVSQTAALQAKAGDAEGAARSFAEAEKLAGSAKGIWKRAILQQLVVSYAKAGNYTKALASVERSTKDAPHELVYALAKPGYFLPEGFIDPDGKGISWTAAKAGDFDEARRVARAIPSAYSTVAALQEIAGIQIEQRDSAGAVETLAEAWKLALALQDGLTKPNRLLEILEVLIAQGAKLDFARMLNVAFESADPAFRGEGAAEQWTSLRSRITRLQAETGDMDAAFAKAYRIDNQKDREWAFRGIAVAQATRGDGTGTLATLALIADQQQQAACVHDVVETFIKRGDFPEAKKAVQILGARAGHARELWWQSFISSIIRALAERGEIDAAKAALTELAGENPEAVCTGRVIISIALIKRGQRAEAAAELSPAIELVKQMKLDSKMAYGRRDGIVNLQIELGDIEGARQIATALGGGVMPVWQLGQVSAGFTKRGEMAKVQALYEEAADPMEKALILLRSAEVLASKP